MATQQLSLISAKLYKEEIVDKILPCIKVLILNENISVRDSLATEIMNLPILLGKRSTTENLIGPFLTLLKDEEI